MSVSVLLLCDTGDRKRHTSGNVNAPWPPLCTDVADSPCSPLVESSLPLIQVTMAGQSQCRAIAIARTVLILIQLSIMTFYLMLPIFDMTI